jgi:hypothetical protein
MGSSNWSAGQASTLFANPTKGAESLPSSAGALLIVAMAIARTKPGAKEYIQEVETWTLPGEPGPQ